MNKAGATGGGWHDGALPSQALLPAHLTGNSGLGLARLGNLGLHAAEGEQQDQACADAEASHGVFAAQAGSSKQVQGCLRLGGSGWA